MPEPRRVADSDWSMPELTRAVTKLTDAVEALRQTIDELDEKFVLRAVHDVELANVRQTQRIQGDVLDRIEQKDIPGLHTRINETRDRAVSKSTVWQVVGALIGLLAVATSLLAIYHR